MQENHAEQNIFITERQRAHLSGIGEVESFTDREIVALSSLGEVIIEGEGLHIEAFSTETGELAVTGYVSGVFYAEERPTQKKGLFGRLTR